jgi:phosphatidylglycerol:prolipoprotein diacylglycerol transferase
MTVLGRPVLFTGYGLFAILGAAAGVALCAAAAQRALFPVFDAFAAATLAVAGGFIGAKLLFVATTMGEGIELPVAIVSQGGLVFYGGVVGGAIAAIIYLRAYRLDVRRFADLAVPGLALGHAIGRLGCVMAGCCYGRPTNLPWGLRFPASPYFGGTPNVPLHPVQLYEASFELLLAGLAWRFLGNLPSGHLFLRWVGGYSAVRLWLECSFRGDDRGAAVLGLAPSAALSIALLTMSVLALAVSRSALTTESKVS